MSAERVEEPTSGVGRAQLTIGQDGLVISSARKEHYPFQISKEGQRTLLRRPPRSCPSVAFP